MVLSLSSFKNTVLKVKVTLARCSEAEFVRHGVTKQAQLPASDRVDMDSFDSVGNLISPS